MNTKPSTSAVNWPLGLLLLAAGLLSFGIGVSHYLAGHQRPWAIGLPFASSLLVAFWYEVRVADLHGSLNRTIATSGIFGLAVIAANPVRQGFLELVAYVQSFPEALEYLGSDIATMMTNHTVGYWGCFAASLAIGRLRAYPVVIAILARVLGRPPAPCCANCGHEQPVPH